MVLSCVSFFPHPLHSPLKCDPSFLLLKIIFLFIFLRLAFSSSKREKGTYCNVLKEKGHTNELKSYLIERTLKECKYG